MSLSCSCELDNDDAEWYWWQPNDYSVYNRKRSNPCCCENCENRVSRNDTVGEVRRTRAGTEWEDIRGLAASDDPEAVKLASVYMCERCTDLYFSFQDLGFNCISPYEDMIELAKEYHETYYSIDTLIDDNNAALKAARGS